MNFALPQFFNSKQNNWWSLHLEPQPWQLHLNLIADTLAPNLVGFCQVFSVDDELWLYEIFTFLAAILRYYQRTLHLVKFTITWSKITLIEVYSTLCSFWCTPICDTVPFLICGGIASKHGGTISSPISVCVFEFLVLYLCICICAQVWIEEKCSI